MKGSKAYFDIRVFNPVAKSYTNQHKANEAQKKREYGERVLNVEHGSFMSLVFSCLGGMSRVLSAASFTTKWLTRSVRNRGLIAETGAHIPFSRSHISETV